MDFARGSWDSIGFVGTMHELRLDDRTAAAVATPEFLGDACPVHRGLRGLLDEVPARGRGGRAWIDRLAEIDCNRSGDLNERRLE